jgi:acyl-CoA thioester hydrolase
MARLDFRCTYPLRVRWSDVDPQGVVFNANYLAYFDVGITEYWRAIGFADSDQSVPSSHDLYMVKSTIEYRLSARYVDMLDICVRCARIGRSSLHFVPEIYRGEELIANAELIYVNVSPATKRSAPVPEFLAQSISKFEVVVPAGLQ